MNATPELFTYDLTELNSSVVFVVAISKKTNRYIKLKSTGALAVFKNKEGLHNYMKNSKVLSDGLPQELTIPEIKEIANRYTSGFYQIVD